VTPRKKQLAIILACFAVVVCVDQITKAIVMAKFPEFHLVANKFFQISLQRNPGIVGGIFRNVPFMAYIAPLLASFVLLYLYRHLEIASKIQSIAYGLVAGGAVGNYIDRIHLGSVTDFLQFNFYFIPFNFPWKYYPAFNVADSCICTGVFLLIVTWWASTPPREGCEGVKGVKA